MCFSFFFSYFFVFLNSLLLSLFVPNSVPVPVPEAFRGEWSSVKTQKDEVTVTVMKESNLPSPRAVTLDPALCGTTVCGER